MNRPDIQFLLIFLPVVSFIKNMLTYPCKKVRKKVFRSCNIDRQSARNVGHSNLPRNFKAIDDPSHSPNNFCRHFFHMWLIPKENNSTDPFRMSVGMSKQNFSPINGIVHSTRKIGRNDILLSFSFQTSPSPFLHFIDSRSCLALCMSHCKNLVINLVSFFSAMQM